VDIGSWIKLPYRELTVPARSFSVVPFTILPPLLATPGDHVGGIVAEQTHGRTSNAGSAPITVVQAVGVRVYGRVVGPLHPRLTLRQLALSVASSVASELGAGADARLSFVVDNPGNTVLSPVVTVKLTTPLGTAARRNLTINQLLPGNSLSYTLTFPGVNPYGHLRAEVSAVGVGVAAAGSATAWALPWALFALVLVVLALVIALFIHAWRRRSARRPDVDTNADHEADARVDAGSDERANATPPSVASDEAPGSVLKSED
jgi:hypothetical protein